jgi:hypothetical protein
MTRDPVRSPAALPEQSDVPWDVILHELRTPLTVALGRLQLLRRRLRREGEQPAVDPELAHIEAALTRLQIALERLEDWPPHNSA